jgi:hypothetical protein
MGGVSDENDYFDRWTRHYSEAVNANLCPYFEWFKVKISDDTKKFCETLPGTLPTCSINLSNLLVFSIFFIPLIL